MADRGRNGRPGYLGGVRRRGGEIMPSVTPARARKVQGVVPGRFARMPLLERLDIRLGPPPEQEPPVLPTARFEVDMHGMPPGTYRLATAVGPGGSVMFRVILSADDGSPLEPCPPPRRWVADAQPRRRVRV